MVSFRDVNGQQLKDNSLLLNELGILFLTNLTEKLLKVVPSEPFDLILLYFASIPLLQAVKMHQTTGSSALARRA